MFKGSWDATRRWDAAWVVMIILGAVGGVSLLHRSPGLTAAFTVGLLALALARWREPLDVALAAVGAVFGPSLEYVATQQELWNYAAVSVARLPAWVFVMWALFPIGLVRLIRVLHVDALRAERLAPQHLVVLGLLLVTVEIPLLGLLGNSHPYLAALLCGVVLVPAVAVTRNPRTYMVLVLGGVLGPVFESFPIAAGAWSYPSAVVAGLAPWLPTGYALFCMALVLTALGVEGLLAAPATHKTQHAAQA